MTTHRDREVESIAMHLAVAEKITDADVDRDRARVVRWREAGRLDAKHSQQWLSVLALPVANLRATLVREDDTMVQLRQSSPFAGVLTESERRRLLRAFRRTHATE